MTNNKGKEEMNINPEDDMYVYPSVVQFIKDNVPEKDMVHLFLFNHMDHKQLGKNI